MKLSHSNHPNLEHFPVQQYLLGSVLSLRKKTDHTIFLTEKRALLDDALQSTPSFEAYPFPDVSPKITLTAWAVHPWEWHQNQ